MQNPRKDVLELLEGKGISPKKASAAKGGEYHSACPGCGGDDRFHVWPEQNSGAGSYWCRQCGKGGDAIQFLIDFDGMSYPEACRALDVDLPEKQQFRTPHVKPQGKGAAAGWQPVGGGDPAEMWRQKAEKLVERAHLQLIENEKQMRWLLERGILKKMVIEHRLGWVPEDFWRHRQSWGLPEELKENNKPKRLWIPQGLVIPRLTGGRPDRIRIRRPEGEPRFYAMPGSNMDCMVLGGGDKRRLAVVIESELDAILLARFVPDLAVIIALGNSSRRPDPAAAEILNAVDLILLALDYDAGGNNQVAWWQDNFPRSKHWPVPAGKDPGDAFKGVDLRAWVIAGCPKGWRVPPSLLGTRAAAVPAQDPASGSEIADKETAPAVPPGVLKLRELLENTPVVIDNTDERTSIRSARSWSGQNWQKSKDISALVFSDPEVFEWILNHPDQKITAENIIK